jgi:hypothetical protein
MEKIILFLFVCMYKLKSHQAEFHREVASSQGCRFFVLFLHSLIAQFNCEFQQG